MRRKRLLSWVLTLAMIAGMFVVPTRADETNTTTISGDGTADQTGQMTITLKIKKTPTASDFTFTPPSNLSYDGQPKTASVTGETGMGDITVEYYSGSTKLSGAPTADGTYTVKVSVAEGTEYKAAENITDASWTFTIAPYSTTMTITLTVEAATVTTAPTAKTLKYNGSAQALVNAGEASGGEMQYALGDSGATAPTSGWGTAIPTGTDAGTYYVWYRAASTHGNSDAACVPVTIDVDAYGMTITLTIYNPATVTAPTARTGLTYTGTAQALVNAGSATGGTIQYALGTDSAATGSYGTAIPQGTSAGTYYVWYKATGDASHTDSEAACVTTTIARRAITVTAADQSMALNGTIATGTDKVSVTSGTLPTGHSITAITLTPDPSSTAAATTSGTITPSAATISDGGNDVTANYDIHYVAGTLTVNKAGITPSVTLDGWTYGATANTPNVTGNTGNGSVSYTYAVKGGTEFSATVPTAAGEYTVKATIAATGNYNGGEATADFTISKATVTVTADAKSKTYGADDPELTASVNGLVSGDSLHYRLSRVAGENVGEYVITVALGENPNYDVTAVSNTFTITKATIFPTLRLVTVQGTNRTDKTAWIYGETDVVPYVEGNTSGGVVTTIYSDTSGNTYAEMPTDAGTYTVQASIAATANYNSVEKTNEVSFTITKAPHSDQTATQTVTVSRNGVANGTLDLSAYLADATWTVKSTDGTLITAASNGGGTVLNYTAAQTTAASSTGSVEITVTSRNYADYTLTVNFRTASAFTLRFDSDGGTEIPSRILNENAAYGALPTAETVKKAGYTFDGWYTDAARTVPATAETSIGSADATVYAKWTLETHTITLDLNGRGSIPDSYTEKTVTDGKIIYSALDSDFVLPVPDDIKDGTSTYTFAGWQKNGTGTAQINVTILVADLENASYTALWVEGEKVGEVTFEKGDADTGLMGLASMDEGTVSTDSGESTAEAGQAAQNLADVMKEVACAESGDGETDKTVTVAMNVAPVNTASAGLDAATKAAIAAIKQQSGSGADAAVKDDLVTIEVQKTTTDSEGNKTDEEKLTDIGRVVEIPLQYNLTGRYRPQIFHFHGGAVIAFTRLATRPVGSFTDGTYYVSGSGASAIIYIYTCSFSTYSITTTETPAHTVMFETNGGSVLESVTVEDQKTLAQPSAPTKESDDSMLFYVFDGWYSTADFSTAYDFHTPVTRDMTLYAKWKENFVYTITFDPGEGSVSPDSEITGTDGKLASLPMPARDGYTFDGWFDGDSGGTQVTKDTVFVTNQTIYAHWTQNAQPTPTPTPTPTPEPEPEPEPEPTPRPSGGSSGGGSTVTHRVTVKTAAHGTVTSSASRIGAKSKVTLTVTPEQGYVLDSLTVTDGYGREMTLTNSRNGTWSFTMPYSDVTVSATFREEAADPTPAPTQTPAETPNPMQSVENCERDGSCPISEFTDLNPDAWYHDGVHYALETGIMNGTGDGRFEPDTATSRAMIVTMLYRMEGEPETSGSMDFQDVPEDSWYARAVHWASGEGIVNGYRVDTFGPNDAITREQTATILYRYAKYKGISVQVDSSALEQFSDASSVSDWAKEAMEWSVSVGLINGMGNGTVSPRTDTTRAQMATLLMRYSKFTV